MTDHAKLSPSARHRWGLCPGSVREEAKYPKPPGGPAAVDGTHSHTLLEHCVKNNLMDPLSLVGTEMKDHEGEFKVTQDQAQRVNVAVSYIKERLRSEPLEIFSEEKVDPSFLLRRDDLHGTVDVQLWGKHVYELIDYKDGMGVVEVKDNPQLEQYAYGVLSWFKLGPLEEYPFDTVRMTVIQPKLAMKGMPAITSHDVLVSDLLRRMHRIQEQAALTDDPNAPLVPGDSQCKFCRAKGACTALAQKSMEGLGLMFQPIGHVNNFMHLAVDDTQPIALPTFLTGNLAINVPTTTLDLAQQSAEKDPATMNNEQLRQILEAAPLIRQMIEGAEKEAERRILAGQPVPGYKLVRGPGRRSWKLPEDEMVKVLTKMGIPKGDVYETKLVSPAAAEKLVWTKKTKDGETKGQLSEKQLMTLEKEYIEKSQGKLTLVPESDSREAVITDASSMFSAIPHGEAMVIIDEVPKLPDVIAQQAPTFEMPAWMK